jgi:hypothetical protein
MKITIIVLAIFLPATASVMGWASDDVRLTVNNLLTELPERLNGNDLVRDAIQLFRDWRG